MPLFRNPWQALSCPQVVAAVEVEAEVDVDDDDRLLAPDEAAPASDVEEAADFSADDAESVFPLFSEASAFVDASVASEADSPWFSDGLSVAFFWPPTGKSVTYQPEPLS